MAKIGAGKAISLAESAFLAWYNGTGVAAKIATFTGGGAWAIGVKNDGTPDFVTPDIEKGIVDTWRGKGAVNGFERRGSISSGESKIDLKFAWPGRTESSFNYHVVVMEDPAIEEARKKQAAADKKIAEDFKKKKAEEDKLKAEAEKDKADDAKKEVVRQKKLTEAANKAWNDLGKKQPKASEEKTWKEKWKKDNDKKVK